MKKQLLTLFAAASLGTAFSQSIPNGGFENWTTINYENPQYWFTQNGNTTKKGGVGIINTTKTNDSYSGVFAVQLNTLLMGTDTVGAYIADGNPGQPAGQGIPYNQKPTSMRFHYKCNVMPGDTALVIIFFKSGGSVISQSIKKITGTQNTYALGVINFSLGVTPDSLIFAAASSNLLTGNFQGIPGSMLQLDSVFFTGVSSQPTNFNGDFETWVPQTSNILNGWELSGTGGGPVNIQTTDAYSGNFALELFTYNNNGTAMEETVTSGHSVQSGTIGGHPYNLQVDTLDFYYKYAPGNVADSARVNLGFKAGGINFANIATLLPAAATYTHVAIKINLGSAPDSLIIFIGSSKTFTTPPLSYAGATLKIDEMSFRSQLVPVADFSLPNTFCVGQAVQLTDMSTNIPTTWTWALVGGGTLSSTTAQNPTVTYGVAGTHTISLTVSNSHGNSVTVYHTINIVSPPVISVSSPTICKGANANVNAVGASTYVWGTGAITSSITVSPTVTTTYFVTGTDVNGCTASGTGTVTVNPLPAPNPGSNSPICQNQNLLLTSVGGFSNYVWSGPNAFSSSQQNPTINGAMPGSSGVYQLTVNDANACVNTMTISVTVNALPNMCIGSNNPVCETLVINFNYCGSSVSTYTWTGPNSFTSSIASPTLTATIPASGTYTLAVTDGNGCSNSTTSNIIVNPLPVPAATSNSPICVGQTLNLFSSGGVSYSWSGPNAFSSTVQNPSTMNVSMAYSGLYTVTVIDANGCIGSDTVSVFINGCAGLNNNADNLLAIYPNPSDGVFTIALSDANATAGVFDLTGKKIAAFNLNNTKSQIDLSTFENGIYFIEITSSQGIFRKKITKTN